MSVRDNREIRGFRRLRARGTLRQVVRDVRKQRGFTKEDQDQARLRHVVDLFLRLQFDSNALSPAASGFILHFILDRREGSFFFYKQKLMWLGQNIGCGGFWSLSRVGQPAGDRF